MTIMSKTSCFFLYQIKLHLQERCFYRQGSSQSKIERSKHENCVKNLVFLFMLNKIASSRTLLLSTGVEPESPKSIGLRTLPPKSFAPQNPLRENPICVLILSTGVAPESPKSISLRTLPPKSFVWVSDKIWNSKHKTKKQLHPQYFLEHGHV